MPTTPWSPGSPSSPAGTLAPLVARLNVGFRYILTGQAMHQRLRDLGAEPADDPPGEHRRVAAKGTVRWSRVMRDANTASSR